MPSETAYLPAAKVRRRYGGKSDAWLFRVLRNDPSFPKPIYVCGQRLWLLSDLEAYEAAEARKVAPPMREGSGAAQRKAAAAAA
jgi:hypothetical protein